MKYEDFEKAKELKEKIDYLESKISDIQLCFEEDYGEPKQERLFLRFLRNQTNKSEKVPTTMMFFPTRLQGLEIDLEEGFVELLLYWLKERVKEAKKEFESIGE